MLPPLVPLFPLPNVVLFPNVFLPLHIFEARYRQLVHEALAGERLIGMVLLKPGYEPNYEGAPPIYPVGCAGTITHVERLPDGRFNIVLRGTTKFRVEREESPSEKVPYRLGHVTALLDEIREDERAFLQQQRAELEKRLAPLFTAAGAGSRQPEIMSDEDLVNALSQYLALEPIEKLALLESPGALVRARALAELLEMKSLADRSASDSGRVH
jgi:Lon protease-like protein